MGDHNDLAPFEPYVFDSPPRFATSTDVPAVKFLGSWGGDNREALFPSGNLFDNAAAMLYDPPGGGTVSSCNGGARNSNAYAAYIGPRIDAFVEPELQAAGRDPAQLCGDDSESQQLAARDPDGDAGEGRIQRFVRSTAAGRERDRQQR